MIRRLSCFVVLLLICLSGAGQRVARVPRQPALPGDPKAMLAVGARSYGLALSGLRDWTITFDYELYDEMGFRKESGVFEEWWAGPDEYRLHFVRPGYHLDAWVTPKGSYVIGDPNLPAAERLVYRWMMEPIPPVVSTEGYELRRRVMLLPDTVQFPCVQMEPLHPAPDDPFPMDPQYCFDSEYPTVRVADTEDGEQVVYRRVAMLRSQFLPGEFVSNVGGQPYLSAQLIGGRIYRELPQSAFAPPAQAVPGPRPDMTVLYLTSGRELDSHAISRPMLPQVVINLRMENTAESLAYSITIGTNGKVTYARVIADNAPEIVDDVTKEIKTWRYRPFLVNGVAVPVRARIWVNFEKRLGGM